MSRTTTVYYKLMVYVKVVMPEWSAHRLLAHNVHHYLRCICESNETFMLKSRPIARTRKTRFENESNLFATSIKK